MLADASIGGDGLRRPKAAAWFFRWATKPCSPLNVGWRKAIGKGKPLGAPANLWSTQSLEGLF
jgi:hypothetical protein